MRILVTGGAGFVGSHLFDRLLSDGHEVIAMDNLVTGSTDNIAHLAGNRRFKFIFHDVTEYIYIPGTLDAVMNLASPASPVDFLRVPIQILKVSSLGTHNLLGLALAKRARFSLPRRPRCTAIHCLSATGDLLGQCGSHRSARGVRRGEAFRGSVTGLSTGPWSRYAHRAHLQHLRAALRLAMAGWCPTSSVRRCAASR